MRTICTEKQLLTRIRVITLFFIAALAISGITAFAVETELRILFSFIGMSTDASPDTFSGLQYWLAVVYDAISNANANYPFLAYGFDWLAFAHLVIAVGFVGVYRKPVRNIWIIYMAMIACVAVIPTVFICGAIRQIPFIWQLVDCSFGVFGMMPLLLLRKYIKDLEVVSGCVEQKY